MGVAKGKTGLKTDTRKSTTATLKINHIVPPRAMAVATALCSIRDPKMQCQLKTLKHKEGVAVIIPKNHHITITIRGITIIIINIMRIVITKMNGKI